MYYFNSQMKLICLLRKNYGDHNFIHVTQQTKLRIAPVALVVTSFSRSRDGRLALAARHL